MTETILRQKAKGTQPLTTENWSFIHVNDSHMGTARSYRFRPAINQRWAAIHQQMSQTDAQLLLHGGDLTRDGESHEYEYQQARSNLDQLPFPSFVIPGNMDVGNKHAHANGSKPKWEAKGWAWDDRDLNMRAARLDRFSRYFGAPHWTFVYRDVRFTGFFAGVAGSGLPQENRLWHMLESLKDLPRTKHHVAMMHYWPFIEFPDEPNWDLTRADEYDNWYFSINEPHRSRLWKLLQQARVNVLFCGHVHTGRPVQEVDGIRLYRTAAAGNTAQMSERWDDAITSFGYHYCQVSPAGIAVRYVEGSDQCEEFDSYGPWGHPAVEERDYSVAREQPPIEPD